MGWKLFLTGCCEIALPKTCLDGPLKSGPSASGVIGPFQSHVCVPRMEDVRCTDYRLRRTLMRHRF